MVPGQSNSEPSSPGHTGVVGVGKAGPAVPPPAGDYTAPLRLSVLSQGPGPPWALPYAQGTSPLSFYSCGGVLKESSKRAQPQLPASCQTTSVPHTGTGPWVSMPPGPGAGPNLLTSEGPSAPRWPSGRPSAGSLRLGTWIC